jgi:arylsulfatase A-like enzyme
VRDGDWKRVSFQSHLWELYNLAEDRTELHNVADRHSDITAPRVKQWHEMAANVLHALPKEQVPVAKTATSQVSDGCSFLAFAAFSRTYSLRLTLNF